jgi:hypothetical protein
MKAGRAGGAGGRGRAVGPMKRGTTGPTNAGDALGLGVGLACFFTLPWLLLGVALPPAAEVPVGVADGDDLACLPGVLVGDVDGLAVARAVAVLVGVGVGVADECGPRAGSVDSVPAALAVATDITTGVADGDGDGDSVGLGVGLAEAGA